MFCIAWMLNIRLVEAARSASALCRSFVTRFTHASVAAS
jgi:hypothetical protein